MQEPKTPRYIQIGGKIHYEYKYHSDTSAKMMVKWDVLSIATAERLADELVDAIVEAKKVQS